MDEIWKDIPGYDGYYQVSNLGRVKSLDRTITRIDGKIKIFKGIMLTPSISNRYLIVSLSRKTHYVHQLVAMSFLGHKPGRQSGLVVDHIDHNTMNNNLNNLQIITIRLNTSKDKFRYNYTSKYVGVRRTINNKWRAYIKINGKNIHLGIFLNEYDAHISYQNKLKEYGT